MSSSLMFALWEYIQFPKIVFSLFFNSSASWTVTEEIVDISVAVEIIQGRSPQSSLMIAGFSPSSAYIKK